MNPASPTDSTSSLPMTALSTSPSFWADRLKASGIHLALSLAIAALAALLVVGIWYPYREISGGRELLLLVVTADVILGPLITLAVFNRKKPWTELRRDVAMVALIQPCKACPCRRGPICGSLTRQAFPMC